MTESAKLPASSTAPAAPTDAAAAGALLRAARQAQGLHIAALAASIKVSPAKLEALEAGRSHELPDHTFARALALTVCRVLKIDATPVLALMPGAPSTGLGLGLGRVDGGLNTPFRDRPGRADPAGWVPWRHPVLWLVAGLLVAAAAFVLVPNVPVADGQAPVADNAAQPVMPPSGAAIVLPGADSPVLLPGDAASAVPAAPVAATVAAPAAAVSAAAGSSMAGNPDGLTLRTVEASWLQVVDGSGKTLLARLVPAGETVALTATPPLRLRIGNVRGTEVSYRGQPVNLAATARDNIANITLP